MDVLSYVALAMLLFMIALVGVAKVDRLKAKLALAEQNVARQEEIGGINEGVWFVCQALASSTDLGNRTRNQTRSLALSGRRDLCGYESFSLDCVTGYRCRRQGCVYAATTTGLVALTSTAGFRQDDDPDHPVHPVRNLAMLRTDLHGDLFSNKIRPKRWRRSGFNLPAEAPTGCATSLSNEERISTVRVFRIAKDTEQFAS